MVVTNNAIQIVLFNFPKFLTFIFYNYVLPTYPTTIVITDNTTQLVLFNFPKLLASIFRIIFCQPTLQRG